MLNSPILTSFGEYKYEKMTLEQVKTAIEEDLVIGGSGINSAIGHEPTAKFLSQLLGIEIKVNRQTVIMKQYDFAIVFKLKTRLPEGKVLTLDEMSKVEYEFGGLTCLKTY